MKQSLFERIKKDRAFVGILIILVIGLILSFIVLFPFLKSILTAIIIAYIFYPVYLWVLKYVKRPGLAAMLVTLLIILLIVAPLIFVINSAVDSLHSISKVKELLNQEPSPQCLEGDNIACSSISKTLEKYQDNPRIKLIIDTTIAKVQAAIFMYSSQFIFAIPRVILSIFIIFFTVYYLFKDGKKMTAFLKENVPLKDHHTKSLIKKFNDMLYAVVYGNFITALIQGVLAGIGYYLFGFEPVFVLTVLTIIAATIPVVGPPVIWVPVVIFKVVEGVTLNNSTLLGQALGMTIYGLLVVGLIDNILKPKIIGDRSDAHPLVIFLGVVGGIFFLGPIGIVYGPLILALTETVIKLIKTEDHET